MKKPYIYVACTYFYKQKTIQNFLISPSSKYYGTKQTKTTIMRGLVPSFMLILHTVSLIKKLPRRAREGLVLTADYSFTENTTDPNQLSYHCQKSYFNQNSTEKFSLPKQNSWLQTFRENINFTSKCLSDQSTYLYVVQTWDMDLQTPQATGLSMVGFWTPNQQVPLAQRNTAVL